MVLKNVKLRIMPQNIHSGVLGADNNVIAINFSLAQNKCFVLAIGDNFNNSNP